jgi:hypothetical protein
LSTEAAHAADGPGQEVAFNRIPFFVSAGLQPGGAYKVAHPYGVDTYMADTSGQVLRPQGYPGYRLFGGTL